MNQHQEDSKFLKRAVEWSAKGIRQKIGDPFGCVVVKDGQIVGEGCNEISSTNDPTAHGQVVAIRNACKNMGVPHLKECTIYTSCEPCPMCMGAIYWAQAVRVVYAATRQQAAHFNFDDQILYDEIPKAQSDRKIVFNQIKMPEAYEVFEEWARINNKNIQ